MSNVDNREELIRLLAVLRYGCHPAHNDEPHELR